MTTTTLFALYELAFAVGIVVFSPRERKPKTASFRYDESAAPLAPRSGPPAGGWNPTQRQIRENDLPRFVDEDGIVRTVFDVREKNY